MSALQVYGCVPVVVADTYWMPHSCFVDWREFAVFVPQDEANRTAQVLEAIPMSRRRRLHERLMKVRSMFAFDRKLRRGAPDAFESHLMEVWLKSEVCART